MTLGGPSRQLLWVHQPRRRHYRARAKSAARQAEQQHLHLGRLEQNREYQRLLARLVRLSKTFQSSLTSEQRRAWLTLEDALLDHAWLLHAYYFKAGYELGKTAARRRSAYGRSSGRDVDDLRDQAVLLSALTKLLDSLIDIGR